MADWEAHARDTTMTATSEPLRTTSLDPSVEDVSELQVRDRRSGREYELPIAEGAIRATDLEQIAVGDVDGGLVSYDPAFVNTASCRSAITYIDGDKGILRYRGYPIEQLVGRITQVDIAWLLIHGELPSTADATVFDNAVESASVLPEPVVRLVETFPVDAHPMAVLLAAWSALGAYHPEAKAVDDAAARMAGVPGFLGQIASVTALVFRHRTGRLDGAARRSAAATPNGC